MCICDSQGSVVAQTLGQVLGHYNFATVIASMDGQPDIHIYAKRRFDLLTQRPHLQITPRTTVLFLLRLGLPLLQQGVLATLTLPSVTPPPSMAVGAPCTNTACTQAPRYPDSDPDLHTFFLFCVQLVSVAKCSEALN